MSDILYLINRINNYFKNYFNEFYEEEMSRPKIIELPEGKVSLSGFSKEVSHELSEYIKNFKKPESEPITPPEKTESLSTGHDVALSVVLNRTTNKYDVVLVNFTPGKNTQIIESCNSKYEAVSRFKIEAMKYKFV